MWTSVLYHMHTGYVTRQDQGETLVYISKEGSIYPVLSQISVRIFKGEEASMQSRKKQKTNKQPYRAT